MAMARNGQRTSCRSRETGCAPANGPTMSTAIHSPSTLLRRLLVVASWLLWALQPAVAGCMRPQRPANRSDRRALQLDVQDAAMCTACNECATGTGRGAAQRTWGPDFRPCWVGAPVTLALPCLPLSAVVPNGGPTWSSTGSEACVQAVILAADKLTADLAPHVKVWLASGAVTLPPRRLRMRRCMHRCRRRRHPLPTTSRPLPGIARRALSHATPLLHAAPAGPRQRCSHLAGRHQGGAQ
jgi:hypothetical protein